MTASYCPPLDGLTIFAGKVTRYSPQLKGECNQSFSLGQGQYASSTVYALGRGKKAFTPKQAAGQSQLRVR